MLAVIAGPFLVRSDSLEEGCELGVVGERYDRLSRGGIEYPQIGWTQICIGECAVCIEYDDQSRVHSENGSTRGVLGDDRVHTRLDVTAVLAEVGVSPTDRARNLGPTPSGLAGSHQPKMWQIPTVCV
jgi:hypothetical protein